MEHEPLVINYTRKYFGYTNPTKTYDALSNLTHENRAPQNMIVLDTSLENNPENELITTTIGTNKKLGESTMLTLHFTTSPTHPSLTALRRALPQHQL
jgi:hypothetical protein